jgi:hypothetical protein
MSPAPTSTTGGAPEGLGVAGEVDPPEPDEGFVGPVGFVDWSPQAVRRATTTGRTIDWSGLKTSCDVLTSLSMSVAVWAENDADR